MWLLAPLRPHFSAALRDVHAVKPSFRVAAATRLGEADATERPAALTGLQTLLADDEPTVRAAAIEALGALDATEHAGEVLRAVADADPRVRAEALAAAPRVAPARRAIDPSLDALDDAAPVVRHCAVIALEHLAKGDPPAAPKALAALLRAGISGEPLPAMPRSESLTLVVRESA